MRRSDFLLFPGHGSNLGALTRSLKQIQKVCGKGTVVGVDTSHPRAALAVDEHLFAAWVDSTAPSPNPAPDVEPEQVKKPARRPRRRKTGDL